MAYAIIVGGGKIGYYLARSLIKRDYEVLLMEKNPANYRAISMDLGDVAMLGDGCEPTTLKSAGVERADIVVAATGDDDDNLVICQMAAHCFGRARIIARVNNPDNEDLFEQLGVHERVSGTQAILNLLGRKVSRESLIPLGALERSNIEIVELILEEQSPLSGARLRDVRLPEETLIISILRNAHAMLPNADLVFEAGDVVVALVPRDREAALREAVGADEAVPGA